MSTCMALGEAARTRRTHRPAGRSETVAGRRSEAAQRIETNRSLSPMTVQIMRFTKLLLGLVLAACAGPLSGQNARQEIYANPDKAGGVYYAYTYDNPARTPAPEGYEPFYISHYGRHGSRMLLRASEYTEVLETFGKAAPRGRFVGVRAGCLTPRGTGLLGRGRQGWRPHAAGGRTALRDCGTVFESYPEVFRGNARIDAQSTVVVRCVLSMAAFCDRLRRMNPELEITRTANNRTTRYLNFFSTAANPGLAPEYLNLLKSESWIQAEERFRKSRMHPERLMARLFAGGKAPADIDPRELMQQLWALAVNEQDTRSGITFRDLFTPEELYAVWECVNYRFYHQRGPGALNRGYALRYATALLEEIIARADSALVRGGALAEPALRARRQPHAPDLPDGFRRLHGRGFRSGSDRGRMARLPYFTDGGQHPDDLLPERGDSRHSGQDTPQRT